MAQNNTKKCLLVDDEPLALDILRNYIERIDQLEIVANCENAFEAFNVLQKEQVDLLFLDIQMPEFSGLDFLRSLQNPPHVILTTAFKQYALEGFELNVLDYLVKPITFERFLQSINRFFDKKQVSQSIPNISTKNTSSNTQSYIFLNVDKKMIKIRLDEILYVESLKDYVRFKTTEEDLVVHRTIKSTEAILPSEQFVRIHRSFIVPLNKIDAYTASHVEIGKHHIPIGGNYKKKILSLLEQHIS